jgi:YlmC/YmxH family sporulation protein
MCRLFDLRRREVVNVCDGRRLGYVCDVEIDLCCGKICAIIVPGPCWFFGLFSFGDDMIIPWDKIKKIGDDLILVEWECKDRKPRKRRLFRGC